MHPAPTYSDRRHRRQCEQRWAGAEEKVVFFCFLCFFVFLGGHSYLSKDILVARAGGAVEERLSRGIRTRRVGAEVLTLPQEGDYLGR